jgi:hypothetical protein
MNKDIAHLLIIDRYYRDIYSLLCKTGACERDNCLKMTLAQKYFIFHYLMLFGSVINIILENYDDIVTFISSFFSIGSKRKEEKNNF